VRDLYRSEHFVVTVDDGRKLARCERTAVGYASLAGVEAALRGLLEALERLDRPSHVLLADLRGAPPRNDASFEGVVGRYNERLFGTFRKVAFLVRLEAGRLQLLRLIPPELGARFRVFTEESAAFDFLVPPAVGPGGPSRGRR
jgi:hypothetical protein